MRQCKVIRRVGGLEDLHPYPRFYEYVIRRVGGLEDSIGRPDQHLIVIRRVGGLEVWMEWAEMILFVIRRVGGLEVIPEHPAVQRGVIRRVGGLEDRDKKSVCPDLVIRRVGGLEVADFHLSAEQIVIRRVGGLEVWCILSRVAGHLFLKKRDHRIGQRRGLPVGVVFGIVGVTGCRSMTREGFVAACCEGYEAKVYGFAWGLASLCKIVSVPIKGRLPCGLGRTRN